MLGAGLLAAPIEALGGWFWFMNNGFDPRRRRALGMMGALAGMVSVRASRSDAAPARTTDFKLRAEAARVAIVGEPYPDTDVWSYNGRVPGPELRGKQSDRLRVAVENLLDQETTVHWHGVRLPNVMDGVPHLTQPPIAPRGGTFVYEFDLPDAGTYWYHPHSRSDEQVGRGLYGALIVEEREPIRVDRDVTWVLGDWRLRRDASISPDFGSFMDVSHNGRIGNTVTINGRVPDRFSARAGERIRLRLVNAANARIFALEFEGHSPSVIALDGQPVAPHVPDGRRVVLGPGGRTDLVLDMVGPPGKSFLVADTSPRQPYRLVALEYSKDRPLREHPLDAPITLPMNPVPEPNLAAAERHHILLGGGMMGGMRSGMMNGQRMQMSEMMRHGMAWAINGVVATGHTHEPLLTLSRGHSYVLALENDTAWHHPMHLHGHAFRVISRNGQPTSYREWRDTVLLEPRERTEVAFVADGRGDWMFHCHILEHQVGGMMGVIRIT
jgi:FtsP/CotA-like multicopper oxidase with cupredoxin domain